MPILHKKKHGQKQYVNEVLGGEAQRRASPLKLTTSKSLRANESHKIEIMRETKMSNLIL
jgi:hypothetical protein